MQFGQLSGTKIYQTPGPLLGKTVTFALSHASQNFTLFDQILLVRKTIPRNSRSVQSVPSKKRRSAGSKFAERIATYANHHFNSGRKMKRFLIAIGICCLQGALCLAQGAEVKVDLTQPGKKVNPRQFGIFFEEINHAGEGGSTDDLIRNGSFTEAPTLDAWSAVHAGAAKVNLFSKPDAP